MQHYEHTHTSDLSASLSCSTVAPGTSFDSSCTPIGSGATASEAPANDGAGAPELGSSFIGMIQRLLERAEFEAVVAVAKDLIGSHPGSLFLNFALGNAHSNLGNHVEAARHCRQFLQSTPAPQNRAFKVANTPAMQNNLGLALKDLGLLDGAEDVFKTLLAGSPDFVPGLINYGNLLNDKSRLDEAKTHFLHAIEVAPEDPLAYWNLHSAASDISTARAVLEMCLSKDSGNQLAIYTLAGLHAFEGDRSYFDALVADGLGNDPVIRSIQWILDQPVMPQIHFNRWSMFDSAIRQADPDRPFYEFGVWMGDSFRYLIDHFPHGFGFDTFDGLPEDWHGLPRGSYTSFGEVPNILGGEFVVGEFKDTLPVFFATRRLKAGLMNFDADLYSSTISALTEASSVIDERTMLIFDEFIVNHNWEQDEYRALEEFCRQRGASYEVLAASLFTKQVVCKLTDL